MTASLQENLDEIDKINTSDKIADIFIKDIYPQLESNNVIPNSIMMIWPSTAAFLRRLNGDIDENPTFKKISFEKMKNLFPISKNLDLVETVPGSIAIASVIFMPTSIFSGKSDSIMPMSLTVLKAPTNL